MSRYDLLPPNATQLERDFSRATSFLERVGPPVPTIRTAKRINIPDSVVPWLIYEYGLGELLPYLSDQRRAIAEGVLWQRIRGTPGSLKVALRWIGLDAFLEESEAGTLRWAEYQLGLEKAPNGLEQIGRLVGIARISQPVRSRLFRVYGGYDERRFRLDYHLLGEGLLCDDSGVYNVEPGWPQLSFGQKTNAQVDAGIAVADGYTHIHGRQVFYPVTWILDRDLLSDGWHVLNHPVLISKTIGSGNTGLNATQQVAPALKFAKAQVVLSEQWTFGDINHCFPCTAEVEVGGTIELSGDALSEVYWALQSIEVNERFWRDTAADSDYDGASISAGWRHRTITAEARIKTLSRWDDRTWETGGTWTNPAGDIAGMSHGRELAVAFFVPALMALAVGTIESE